MVIIQKLQAYPRLSLFNKGGNSVADGFIIRKGDNISKAPTALIAVAYPVGSVCTITNGNKTITAKDTNGSALFGVELGTWMVSCTDGTRNADQTVVIDDTNKTAAVELAYKLVLFDAGTYAPETGGWSKSGSKLSISASTTSMNGATDTVYTNNKIDVSGYNTINFQITSTSKTENGYRIVGLSTTTSGGSFVAYGDVTSTGEVSIDISSVTKLCYARMALEAWPPENGVSSSTSIVASKVWLE